MDGRPIRVTPTLEDFKKAKEADLRRVIQGTGDDVNRHIQTQLEDLENSYKKAVIERLDRMTVSLIEKLRTLYAHSKDNEGILFVLMQEFFENFLYMLQDIEGMEGTPDSIDISKGLVHGVYHTEDIRTTERSTSLSVRTIIVIGMLVDRFIEKRRERYIDQRFSQEFRHDPKGLLHIAAGAKGSYIEYPNTEDVELRQIFYLLPPQNKTSYNLELFENFVKGLVEITDSFEDIVKSHLKSQ